MQMKLWGEETAQLMTQDNSYVGLQLAGQEYGRGKGRLSKPWENQ
jgi:hypothetical protein